MAVHEVNSIVGVKISEEVRRAMEAVKLLEVQDMIRRLGDYGLGVCVAHQHTEDMDFATLPDDLVQVEENCQVRWVKRSETLGMTHAIPVAWRWSESAHGAQAGALCTQICKPNEKTGHQKRHFPINT